MTTALEPLLTAREVGAAFGFSAATVVDWAERGELPAFKVGGRLRFREAELADWLERRRTNPAPSMREPGSLSGLKGSRGDHDECNP